MKLKPRLRPGNSSGQAQFIEYVLTVMFSVFVIVSLIALLYSFYLSSITAEIRQSLKQIAVQTSDSVVKLYEASHSSKVSPSNYSSMLVSSVDLGLPTQVARRGYQVILVSASPIWMSLINFTVAGENRTIPLEETSGAKIIAQTIQSPVVTVTYDIPNIGVSVLGRSVDGADSVLRYYRYNVDGTMYDAILLGNNTVMISITSVG